MKPLLQQRISTRTREIKKKVRLVFEKSTIVSEAKHKQQREIENSKAKSPLEQ